MKNLFVPLILCITVFLSSCSSNQRLQYYSNPNHYITATGTVTHIQYNEKQDSLYLGLEQLPTVFSDNSFKIVGENLLIVQKNGIDQKLQIGEQIEFISAPKYFGDGYVMPIVGITVASEVLLTFEQGYHNWIDWMNTGG